MRFFVLLSFLFLCFATSMANVSGYDSLQSQALRFDSLFIYNDAGEITGRSITGFDAENRQVMYAEFDFLNGLWIGNVMQVLCYKEDKQVMVDFFWEINGWMPSDMTVVEYDNDHRQQSSYYQWEDDSWLLEKILK